MIAQVFCMKHTEKDNECKLEHFKYCNRKRVDKITIKYIIFITCFQQFYEPILWTNVIFLWTNVLIPIIKILDQLFIYSIS